MRGKGTPGEHGRGTWDGDLEDARPERSYTVIFDGECALCRRSVEVLKKQDRSQVLECLPAQSAEVGERFPWLETEALLESIHLVGPGQTSTSGARAIEELVRVLPGWRWGRWLFRLPLVRLVLDRVYRWVAANRIRSSCGDHCRDP